MCGWRHVGCLSSVFPDLLSLSLSVSFSTFFSWTFYFFFFFKEGKVSWFLACQRRVPLRITLAKPLSLQEIQCLLKKMVGVENQGEVLFFLSFSLFPWKVITSLKKSLFFWHSSFLVTAFHISPFLLLLFFKILLLQAGWWIFRSGKCEGRCLSEGEGERGGSSGEGFAHWEAMLNIHGKCLLF